MKSTIENTNLCWKRGREKGFEGSGLLEVDFAKNSELFLNKVLLHPGVTEKEAYIFVKDFEVNLEHPRISLFSFPHTPSLPWDAGVEGNANTISTPT